VPAVEEHKSGKRWSRRNGTALDRDRFDDAEIRAGRYPLGGVPVQVLTLGFDCPSFDGLGGVSLRGGLNTEAGRQA